MDITSDTFFLVAALEGDTKEFPLNYVPYLTPVVASQKEICHINMSKKDSQRGTTKLFFLNNLE